ncbi:MAG: SLBB domain-containing protein [Planctomycetes bacterium]|nr:SLBB domain-containing protein [Planctomycetota bacterium]
MFFPLSACETAAPPPRRRDAEPPDRPPVRETRRPPAPTQEKTFEDVERELGLASGTLKADLEAEYQAETGDLLAVTCLSHKSLTQEAAVSPDGKLVLTGIGSVVVRGLTLAQAETAITEAAAAAGVRKPRFAVSVKTLGKKYVTLVGPQMTGGRLEIHGRGTILETLAGAGWKPDRRSVRRLALVRRERTSVLDLEQIAGTARVSLNLKLRANDILIVVEKDPVDVKGSVQFPGTYAVPPTGVLEVRDAIALAGGLKYPVDVRTVRVLHADGRSATFDLNDYLFRPGAAPSCVLRPGDTVFFPQQREFSVFVLGMVKKPGQVKVPGPITVSRALAMADHERFGAVLSHCSLVRGYPDKPEVIGIDFNALFRGDTRFDLVMNDGDVLYVPESALSNVLDLVERILRPFAGATPTAVQIYTATQIGK